MIRGFNALRGRCNVEAIRKGERRRNDRSTVGAFCHILGERFIDLDLVEGKLGQVADRRVSSSKIIEDHDDTEVLELSDSMKMRLSAF